MRGIFEARWGPPPPRKSILRRQGILNVDIEGFLDQNSAPHRGCQRGPVSHELKSERKVGKMGTGNVSAGTTFQRAQLTRDENIASRNDSTSFGVSETKDGQVSIYQRSKASHLANKFIEGWARLVRFFNPVPGLVRPGHNIVQRIKHENDLAQAELHDQLKRGVGDQLAQRLFEPLSFRPGQKVRGYHLQDINNQLQIWRDGRDTEDSFRAIEDYRDMKHDSVSNISDVEQTERLRSQIRHFVQAHVTKETDFLPDSVRDEILDFQAEESVELSETEPTRIYVERELSMPDAWEVEDVDNNLDPNHSSTGWDHKKQGLQTKRFDTSKIDQELDEIAHEIDEIERMDPEDQNTYEVNELTQRKDRLTQTKQLFQELETMSLEQLKNFRDNELSKVETSANRTMQFELDGRRGFHPSRFVRPRPEPEMASFSRKTTGSVYSTTSTLDIEDDDEFETSERRDTLDTLSTNSNASARSSIAQTQPNADFEATIGIHRESDVFDEYLTTTGKGEYDIDDHIDDLNENDLDAQDTHFDEGDYADNDTAAGGTTNNTAKETTKSAAGSDDRLDAESVQEKDVPASDRKLSTQSIERHRPSIELNPDEGDITTDDFSEPEEEIDPTQFDGDQSRTQRETETKHGEFDRENDPQYMDDAPKRGPVSVSGRTPGAGTDHLPGNAQISSPDPRVSVRSGLDGDARSSVASGTSLSTKILEEIRAISDHDDVALASELVSKENAAKSQKVEDSYVLSDPDDIFQDEIVPLNKPVPAQRVAVASDNYDTASIDKKLSELEIVNVQSDESEQSEKKSALKAQLTSVLTSLRDFNDTAKSHDADAGRIDEDDYYDDQDYKMLESGAQRLHYLMENLDTLVKTVAGLDFDPPKLSEAEHDEISKMGSTNVAPRTRLYQSQIQSDIQSCRSALHGIVNSLDALENYAVDIELIESRDDDDYEEPVQKYQNAPDQKENKVAASPEEIKEAQEAQKQREAKVASEIEEARNDSELYQKLHATKSEVQKLQSMVAQL